MKEKKNRQVVVKVNWSTDNQRWNSIIYRDIFSPVGDRYEDSTDARLSFIAKACKYVYHKLHDVGLDEGRVTLYIVRAYTHPFGDENTFMGF